MLALAQGQADCIALVPVRHPIFQVRISVFLIMHALGLPAAHLIDLNHPGLLYRPPAVRLNHAQMVSLHDTSATFPDTYRIQVMVRSTETWVWYIL